MIEYIKDKWIMIICFIFMNAFLFVSLQAFGLSGYSVCFIMMITILFFVTAFLIDAFWRVSYMVRLEKTLDKLTPKHLIGEVMEPGGTYETQKLYDILKVLTKSLNEQISGFKRDNQEYREYVEMWVHEIKTPIASSMLLIENNPNDMGKSLLEELNKIDSYINQALYYAKSNSVEKDYVIRECNLGEEVRKIIKKKSQDFIMRNISLSIEKLDYSIYTDNKWLEFILGQLFDNAIKYMDKDEKRIEIKAVENENSISLLIADNGMGICKKDIEKIFQKGFVGENGRILARSTGIGLYLCNKLCDKLGLGLFISSVEGEGTTVQINFPKSKYSLLEG